MLGNDRAVSSIDKFYQPRYAGAGKIKNFREVFLLRLLLVYADLILMMQQLSFQERIRGGKRLLLLKAIITVRHSVPLR